MRIFYLILIKKIVLFIRYCSEVFFLTEYINGSNKLDPLV